MTERDNIQAVIDALNHALLDIHAALLQLNALIAEPVPVAPDPVLPEPAVPDAPYSAAINSYSAGLWKNGISTGTASMISVKNTPENRAAFANESFVFLYGETAPRQVYWPQANGSDLSIHVRGGRIDADTSGYPHHLRSFGPAAATAPPAEGNGKRASFDFDVKFMLVNIAGAEFASGSLPGTHDHHYRHPREADMVLLKRALDANAFRYPFLWERLQPTLFGAFDPDEVARMKGVADLATKHELRILWDVHNYMRYRINGTQHLIGSVQVPVAAYLDFVSKFTATVKDWPASWMFGLMNEPYVRQPQWAEIAQLAYDKVQQINPGMWVAVAGEAWSSSYDWEGKNPWFPLARDKYVVYEFHTYLDSDSSGSYKDRSAAIPADAGTRRMLGTKNAIDVAKRLNRPMICGEISVPHDMPQSADGIRNALQALADNDILCFWWAAGSKWMQSSANALQWQGEYREPISILREFKDRTIRTPGPFPK